MTSTDGLKNLKSLYLHVKNAVNGEGNIVLQEVVCQDRFVLFLYSNSMSDIFISASVSIPLIFSPFSWYALSSMVCKRVQVLCSISIGINHFSCNCIGWGQLWAGPRFCMHFPLMILIPCALAKLQMSTTVMSSVNSAGTLSGQHAAWGTLKKKWWILRWVLTIGMFIYACIMLNKANHIVYQFSSGC